MKKLHLVCNAHLDPVWMWDWHEGAASALSTFYAAAELADEYDYVFCHNEAILYEYVEKFAPELFARICSLVKRGKWHIMGGWYLQPDCMLPCGESFLRQIALGREYFGEKFGVCPTAAMNVDSFGHTRGLVQILRKSGFDSYLICRPMPQVFALPDLPFLWRGYDGSTVKALRISDVTTYCSGLGTAKNDILRKAECFLNEESGLALWGVGNHGGGASRKDLTDIQALMREKRNEYEIVHSTLENYFADVAPAQTVDSPLPCFVKSYSSISRIKQAHAQLENNLYACERACAAASLAGKYEYNYQAFATAERMLCAMQFHDVLSGTCTREGEQSTLQKAAHASELLRGEFLKAFHSLAKDLPAAKEGENPFVLFGFQPYAHVTVAETEILIPDALVSDTEEYKITVRQNGKEIPSQVIKELSNINYDRRKRVAYICELNPLGISRVDVTYEVAPKAPRALDDENDIVISDSVKTVRIGRRSGLMESFAVNGKEYLSGGAFAPVSFDDNADPWGWNMRSLGTNLQAFALHEGGGMFGDLRGVHVTERGDVLTEAESLFTYGDSYVRIVYKIYNDLPYADVRADVWWNERQKGLKLKIPAAFAGDYFGQTAYGTQDYPPDGSENVSQRFVGTGEREEQCLCIYGSGVYGNSKRGNDLYLTLLNGSAYCAHPIDGRPLVASDRFIEGIEQGAHTFCLRVAVNDRRDCEKRAQEFAFTPYSVNMYPHGNGNAAEGTVMLSDTRIVLSAFKRCKNGDYLLRLFNNTEERVSCTLTVDGARKKITLGAYAFETYTYNKKTLEEADSAALY